MLCVDYTSILKKIKWKQRLLTRLTNKKKRKQIPNVRNENVYINKDTKETKNMRGC